jgi:predicted ATPase
VWKPGLSRNKLSLILERYQASDEHTKGVLKEYDTYGFNPFQQISLSSRERIQILTGANSNGKSTLMRSIGLALNAGMTGRKIQAVRSS